MDRLKGWVGTPQMSSENASSQSNDRADQETADLQDAMLSASYIMDDDMESAAKNLEKNDSSYHILGRGIITFLRAIIGSEPIYKEEASRLLAQAEISSSEAKRRSERDSTTYRSKIYPPGTEHALCVAMAQIMFAAVAVLNENVIEALKGFYKMRKAYLTLEGIAQIERDYLRLHGSEHTSVKSSQGNGESIQPPLRKISGPVDQTDSDEDVEFYDADEKESNTINDMYLGRLQKRKSSCYDSENEHEHPQSENNWAEASVHDGPAARALITHPIDVFVQSGTSLYFGIILLMLSLVPPSFARLLSVIGFRGDRKRGLDLLWRASSVRTDINGSIAALILTGFYTGLISNLDILPASAYPKKRIDNIMHDMSQTYPNSRLWFLEKVRSRSAGKDSEGAVAMLEEVEKTKCRLLQVEALQWFEKSLNLMSLHDFTSCAESFEKCVQLNNWSHGFYYYSSACCNIELYRLHATAKASILPPAFGERLKAITPNSELATKHAEVAKKILTEKVPGLMGKRKLIGRQLPFDSFVLRKLAKWKARADRLGCELIDAIGVSPLEEMIFFWGGYNRMLPVNLHDSLVRLAWSDGAADEILLPAVPDAPALPHVGPIALKACSDADERATLALLRACVYGRLGRADLQRQILEKENMIDAKASSHRPHANAESWPIPASRYELAVTAWVESGGSTGPDAAAVGVTAKDSGKTRQPARSRQFNTDKLMECSRLIEEVAGWEGFDLDSRFGIKVSIGRETLRALGVVNGKIV